MANFAGTRTSNNKGLLLMRQPPKPNLLPLMVVTKRRQAVSASIIEQRPLELLVHICKNTDTFI